MATLTKKQLSKIDILLNQYKPDFSFDIEHWENGNFDDSYEYGIECGEQYVLESLRNIILDTTPVSVVQE